MAWVVFLKGVNVGGHRRFRPSMLAATLAKYGLVNIGAAGTFIVTKPISQAELRLQLRCAIPFQVEIMICSAKDIINLASGDPFAVGPRATQIVRFVNILAKRPRVLPSLPLSLPSDEDWLVKIVAIQGRFAFGCYRRTMRTISLLRQLEKHLGRSATTRNWNTINAIIQILKANQQP